MNAKELSITWSGDIVSIAGRAQYARALLEPLIKAGVHVRLEPVQPTKPPADLQPFWHEVLQKNTKLAPGTVKISHATPNEATPNIVGGPHILFTHWDTIQYPLQWIEPTNKNFAAVWTGSKTAIDNTKKLGLINKEFTHVPYPIYMDLNPNDKSEINGINKDTLVFGATGTWDQRANMTDLIVAFTTEFGKNDNVALVIKTAPPNPLDNNQKQYIYQTVKAIKDTVNKSDKPPIIVIQDVFTESAMDRIIRRFDIYVTAERGSGHNITMAKCLAQGKPVIAPYCGVFQDYYYVYQKYDKMLRRASVVPDIVSGYPNGNPLDRWTRPDCDSLLKQIRMAYMDQRASFGDIVKQGKALQEDIKSGPFSPDVVLQSMLESIDKLMPANRIVFA